MKFYPIFLDLRGRECVVVGGGEVATRKIEGLLKAGTRITVISPETTETIRQWEREGELRHIRRPYERGDLKGCFLAYAATGILQVDKAIVEEAQSEGVLLNVVDRPALCDFITPSMLERGDLTIAISTGGKSPGLARKLRKELEVIVGPEYEKALEVVAKVRQGLMVQPLINGEARRKVLAALVDSPLIDLMRQGNVEAVEALLHQVTGGMHGLDEEEGQPSKEARRHPSNKKLGYIFGMLFLFGGTWNLPILFAAGGAAIYKSHCSPCHGVTGKGDGPAATALNPKPRDHTDGKYMNALSDQHLFTVIKKGGASVNRSSLMPAWGGQLSDEQIRQLITHLRTLAPPPYNKQ